MPLRFLSGLWRESAEWLIRCDTCGREKSLLSAGGVRWKARGLVHTMGWCRGCGGLRAMTIHHPTRAPLS